MVNRSTNCQAAQKENTQLSPEHVTVGPNVSETRVNASPREAPTATKTPLEVQEFAAHTTQMFEDTGA